jgi:multidrug efflux pump
MLRTWSPRVRSALADLPELVDVNTDQQDKGLQTSLVIDRDAAARLGVTTRMIDATLNDVFGQRLVSTIYNPLNQYRVVMEAAPQYWQNPEALKSVDVKGANNTQIPLAAISRYETTNTPLSVSHQSQFAATTISFNLPPDTSLSKATDAVRTAMDRIGVPTGVYGTFQGTARAFQASLDSQPFLILTALIAVYLVLGMLYESLVHPVTILSTLPSAGVGAILALLAFGSELNIISMIGVILLIGIVKKNAIMMIDFAIDAQRARGLTPEQAIFEACLVRFRPIMMTTMAALLAAVPLAIGFGEGAELRRPLGIAIVGGLIVSQMLTLYSTPVIYVYLDGFRSWVARMRNKTAFKLKTT